MKRTLIPLLILLICAFIITGCKSSSPTIATPKPTAPAATVTATPQPTTTTPAAITPRYGGTFTMLYNTGLPTLGSMVDMGISGVVRNVIPAIEQLLRLDTNGNVVPWLAESFDITPDGKTITLHIRKGIKFHDGTDFNAEAVKYNLEAVLAANIPGSAVLKKVAGYEILDPYTLRINLAKYDYALMNGLASGSIGSMFSPTAMKKPTTAENQAKDHMVGTGPFLFDSWQRDNYVKYKKNPNYWVPGKPYLDAIQLTVFADVSVGLMAFKSGVAQFITTIEPIDAAQLQKEGYYIAKPTVGFFFGIMTNSNNPKSPFADKKVRQALEYAIDKKTMAEGIGMGNWEALYQGAVKSSPWYDPSLTPRLYDPAKAKQLLADAGYPNGFTTKIVSDVRVRKDALIAVQTYLKNVGITTDLDIADVARASTITRQGWEGIYMPGAPTVAPSTILGLYNAFYDPTTKVSIYKPAEWQDKWDAIVAQVDDIKRLAQVKELVKIMYDESNVIYIWADSPQGAEPMGTVYVMVNGKAALYELSPFGGSMDYHPEDVWLSK